MTNQIATRRIEKGEQMRRSIFGWARSTVCLRRIAAASIASCGVLSLGGIVAPASAATESVSCSDYNLPAPYDGTTYSINGTLCVPDGTPPETVMVLVPGMTYTQDYWNIPIDPDTNNFRLAMNNAGYATFALDRLGSGLSSIPASVQVTALAEAGTLHDVIQALRAGDVGGQSFSQVILGGHSLGSFDAIYEAATYHDVNGLFLTGFSHNINLINATVLLTTGIQPAADDPQLASQGFGFGYITTLPSGRKMFYGPGADVAPALQQWDEATKTATSLIELATALPSTLPVPIDPSLIPPETLPSSNAIDTNVLLIDGADDNFACSPIVDNCQSDSSMQSTEQPFFSNANSFEAEVIPGAGHDINLSVNAPEEQEEVIGWANRWVGTS